MVQRYHTPDKNQVKAHHARAATSKYLELQRAPRPPGNPADVPRGLRAPRRVRRGSEGVLPVLEAARGGAGVVPAGQSAVGDDRAWVVFWEDGPRARAAGKGPDPAIAVLVLRRHLLGRLVD